MSVEPKPGVLEGQTVKEDLELSADVCIIGTGPGGAVSAATLQAAGLKVVLLEAGPYMTKDRFRMVEAEAYPALYQDGAARSTKDLAVVILQGKAVGGGTVVNWTTCFRTPEHVVEHWRRHHGVTSIDSAHLAPFFERAEERLGIHKVPVELMNRNNRLLYEGCRALDIAVDTIKRNVRGCAQTGFCGQGCPIDAKQSMLVTYLPDAMSRGATVVSRCRVDRLVFEGSQVKAAEATLLVADGTRPTGHKARVTAKRFIVSGGAINTPALLLRSGAPDPNQAIGKRTFLHPVVIAGGIYDEPVEGYYGAPQSAASHHFADRGDEVGYFLETAPVHPGLASTSLPGHGAAHRRLMKSLPFVAAHIAITIDGFHDDVPGGVVELGAEGHPVLDYPVAPKVWAAFREAHKVLARIHLSQGAKGVVTAHDPVDFIKSEADVAKIDGLPYGPGRVFVASAHQMGGSMMSDDDKQGVVRADDLRHKSVENLHIIDGSVFPTSLGVNPQLSIYGLAGLTSKKLADQWT